LFARGDGIRFVTTADLTLSASSGAVTVAAETAGEIGNTKAGTVFTMVSPVLGIQSSAPVGLSGISGGSDVESDADLRSRLIRRIQGSAQGGADYDYETWALEVPGITRAWVLPLHNGLGTVSVAVVRDNDESIIPDEREIARVQEHIEEVRPVTARVTVIAPVEKKVQYRINLAPDTAENRAGVEAALKSFHLRESSMGGTLYLSRISEAISLAPNEFMHVMSEPAKDVTCAPNEILTFGGVVWPS
ncbi:MAG: baseplate J/gp47 family protein, partial [Neisseria sp.]|nr:baseplate J/gp47 family protein [Neisseria sp.]